MADPMLIAKNAQTECALLPGLANRHGLITGATGTGKTVTLQKLAESFSQIGVPVFMADIKGDLTGISQAGSIGGKMAGVLQERGIELPAPIACPTTLWDVFGEQGHPVRATVSDMGPLLLSRMLDLNDTQVTDAGLAVLVGLPALERLRLANTRVSDAGFRQHLETHPGLVELDLRGTGVTREAIAAWKSARSGRRALR